MLLDYFAAPGLPNKSARWAPSVRKAETRGKTAGLHLERPAGAAQEKLH